MKTIFLVPNQIEGTISSFSLSVSDFLASAERGDKGGIYWKGFSPVDTVRSS